MGEYSAPPSVLPKPGFGIGNRNEVIGIRTDFFFLISLFLFSLCFPTSWGDIDFEKLEIEHKSSKINPKILHI